MATIPLEAVDRVEVLSVMDNSIDVLMGNTPIARRARRERDALSKPQLRAEHGVSMLVTTYEGKDKDSFLFDTGVTVDGVLHNMDVLGIKGNELHAVIGGFHLTGPTFEPIIAPTIQTLKEFQPSIIVPEHCTGWKATHLLAREFPDAFTPNSVGTTMVIGS